MQSSEKDLRNPLDNVKKSIYALKVLDYNRKYISDAVILNIILQKLDKDMRKNYEMTISSNVVPMLNGLIVVPWLNGLIVVLENNSRILENINKKNSIKPKSNQGRNFKPKYLFDIY